MESGELLVDQQHWTRLDTSEPGALYGSRDIGTRCVLSEPGTQNQVIKEAGEMQGNQVKYKRTRWDASEPGELQGNQKHKTKLQEKLVSYLRTKCLTNK